MGIGVIVHGYIECPGFAPGDAAKRIHRANRRAIRGLPLSDEDWPYITRGMFSLLPLRTSLERRIAQYEYQVIHFAGDYKNMYVLEAEWVEKFERLLARLCWYRAVVLIEFTSMRYEWEVSFDHIGERYECIPPRPPTEWSFRSYRVDKKTLSPGKAIDGPLSSPHHTAFLAESDDDELR